jgi:aminoglycoside phosphotransferase (APT) family kinase protein
MVTEREVVALVDRAALARHLRRVAPMGADLEVEVLSGGLSNLTYRVRTGPHEYVARRRPLGLVGAGAHDMAREYRVLSALKGSDLPLPTVFGYWDDESTMGAPFYIMSLVRGHVFHRRQDVAGLRPEQAQAISEETMTVLDRLHRVDTHAVGLANLGRPEGFVARRIGRWVDQWQRSPHRDHPLVEHLAGQLARTVPEHTDSTLVHGDYRLGNMIVQADGPPRVAAVLDWEMATLGDPLTDLAHLLVYWERSGDRTTHESQTISEHPGFLDGDRLAQLYASRSGRDLARLNFYLAFEHWRAAIIKEGIVMRTAGGDHPTHEADELAASVGRHLEEASDLLAKERS